MIELAVFAGCFPVKRTGEVHQAHHQLIDLLHSHMVEHPDFARSTHWCFSGEEPLQLKPCLR